MEKPDISSPTTTDPPQDVSKYGLSIISNGGNTPDLDIIFVHGLQGHPEKTWSTKALPSKQPSPFKWWRPSHWRRRKHRSRTYEEVEESGGQKCFWPRDLLAADFPNARICTYGYDSAICHFFNGPANTSTINDHGEDLLNRTAAIRSQCRGRPLMFIAHSLGGLVVKSTLRLANNAEDTDLRDINKSTVAVLFFGTPHRGSQWADVGAIVERFAKFMGFSTANLNLDLLRPNNALLQILRVDFTQRLDRDRLKVTSFQERLGYKAVNGLDDLIVDAGASEINHRKERVHGINANHMDMCKFGKTGQSHTDYQQLVKPEITRHIGDIDDEIQSSISPLLQFQRHLNTRKDQLATPDKRALAWLFRDAPDGPGLMKWLSSGCGIYWIQGLPGSGKSTAMKALVQSSSCHKILQQNGWEHASMFISDKVGPTSRSWKGVLGAMLSHVLQKRRTQLGPLLKSFVLPRLPSPAINHNEDMPNEVLDWTMDQIKDILLQCKTQTTVRFSWCFFIDGLDEHDKAETSGSESIIEFLEKLVATDGPGLGKFKFCVASRPENEFYIPLRYNAGFRMQDWTRMDIEKYVFDRLGSHPDAQNPVQPENYRQMLHQISETIVSRACGLFIWVRWIVEEVLHGMTNGITEASLFEIITQVPNGGLPDFYLQILEKTPKQTRRLTGCLLETISRAQKPVTVLDVGVLLSALTRGLRGDRLFDNFPKDELLRLSKDGANLERTIKRLSGGLLQVVRPGDEEEIETLHSIAISHSQHDVHAPTWRVRFLHQTVKEFLECRIHSPQWLREAVGKNSMDNGDSLHLQIAAVALGMSKETRSQCLWELNPMETVVRHAPKADVITGHSLFHLLNRLDQRCANESPRKDCWIVDYTMLEDPTWVPTFLAFAVWSNMKSFVETALGGGSRRVSKKGRPLLHFAGGYPGRLPNPEMADILLKASANPNEKSGGSDWSETPLESIVSREIEGDGTAHYDFIKLLITRGADVSRPTSEGHTVLHAIASMKMDWDMKFDIIREISRKSDLNNKNREHRTVFHALILSANEHRAAVREDHVRELLESGAKITTELAREIYKGALEAYIRDMFTEDLGRNLRYYELGSMMRRHKVVKAKAIEKRSRTLSLTRS